MQKYKDWTVLFSFKLLRECHETETVYRWEYTFGNLRIDRFEDQTAVCTLNFFYLSSAVKRPGLGGFFEVFAAYSRAALR